MRRLAMRVLQTLVLTTRKQRKTNRTVVARVLIMITQTVHVLVPALAIRDATSKRPQSSLSLPLNFPHLTLADHPI